MCDYQMEYSFIFEDSSCEGDASMASYDNGFESMWHQVREELQREREVNELCQVFQQNLSMSPPVIADRWRF
ncbi:GD11659 [Drosophila simulans]|uniref:GD11659 n=1 Tax=Drosophila simulans TaxID=7240 RepID=B4QH43_DROSI|nr:GD11659 [Drosophila simulans]